MLGFHVRSETKTWGGVELENFDFNSLKRAHYLKNRRISVAYERIFVQFSLKKSTFCGEKWPKNELFGWFLVAQTGARKL